MQIAFKNLRKFVLVPILVLAICGPILAPFAESFNFPDRYDLVAVLVEQGLYADEKDYDGLALAASNAAIARTNIKARVDRYAIDLQSALPGTRALIIQVDRFEKPSNVSAVLERLYFEGDPKEPTRTAYLRGVVVVGEVPLPVVNKRGNRFISLFPYTDFEQKAYVWNPETQDFELAGENANPHPEIWHGVIRSPLSTQYESGKELIAAYFDKNHLYHIGDSSYSVFDKKVFFQDFVEEKKNLNAAVYKNYLNFIEHQDDISYMRYTKELYEDLAGPIEQDMAEEAAEAKRLTDEAVALGIPMDSNVPSPDIPDDAPAEVKQAVAGNVPAVNKNDLSDIMTKIGKDKMSMSDNLMYRFNQLFTKYPNLINDFIKYTGRYSNADSAINLITAKDDYSAEYLRTLNNKAEAKIDEIINSLQKDILITTVGIQVNSVKLKAPFLGFANLGADIPMPPGASLDNPKIEYVNFSPAFSPGNSFPNRLNGWTLAEISNVSQCSAYRGSRGEGKYSKLVEINRGFNMESGSDFDKDANVVTGRTSYEKRTPNTEDADAGYLCRFGGEFQTRGACEGYEHFAGCFYDNIGHILDNPQAGAQVCFPEHATNPVLDVAGTRKLLEAENPPQNWDNFKSCLNFYEKEQYKKYLGSIDSRLEKLGDDYDRKSGYLAPRQVKLNRISSERLEPKDVINNPDSVKMFYFSVPDVPGLPGISFEVTLGDVLATRGWNKQADPNGWRQILQNLIIGSLLLAENFNVAINHPRVSDVKYSVLRTGERRIKSVFYHKEPTNETLNAQVKNMFASDLPVDNPRYVTFQDINGGVQKIVYPDIFKSESFTNFASALADIENQLNAVPRQPGSPLVCSQCLKNLFGPAESLKAVDAIEWKKMDIDSKHTYKDAYVGETQNGYELAYFNGEGASDHYEFSLVPEQEGQETDEAFNKGKEEQAKLAAEQEEAYEDDPDNPFDDDSGGGSRGTQGGYDLFSWHPPPISPWWDRMGEWADSLKETVNQFKFGESSEDFYGGLEDENKKLLEEIQQESKDADKYYETGEELGLSKIASIALETDSSVVSTDKRIDVQLVLKDKNGNIVSDEFEKVALALEGEGKFVEDLNGEVMVMSGKRGIGLITPQNAGNMKLKAQLAGSNKTAEILFTVVADAKLVLQTPETGFVADGKKSVLIGVTAVDGSGQIISAANGTVRLAVSDTALGSVVEKEIRLSKGRSAFHFIAGKKKGKIIINATNAAFDSGQLELNLLPGQPVRLALTSDNITLVQEPDSRVVLTASLFDANGNMVDTNSAAQVNFRISESTKRFGNLLEQSMRVTNGAAAVSLSPSEESGAVNIIAESPGLTPASISIKSVKYFGQNEVSQMKSDSLAAAILGIPGGDVSQPNYLGGWFVMSGKTQAAASLTSQPKLYKKLFEINSQGGINMPEPDRISAKFLHANNFTLVLRDNKSQQNLAQVSVFAMPDGQFEITNESNTENLADGIYIKKTAEDAVYQIDRTKGALRLTKDGTERVEVQTNGYTRLLDNNFSLRPINNKYLVLEVLDLGAPVAQIIFVQRFSQDVRIQEKLSKAPGVYVSPMSLPPQFYFQKMFGGNSSSEPFGIAFYDKTEEITDESAPGFGFQSLEDSIDRFGVGFTEENKFALLFSAGEMFGEANRPYASDIGIVLGDPSVRINNAPLEGMFSQDIGKLIYAASADVRGIINLDYDTDGDDDIFVVEGEEKVRLLQNNGGYDSLKDQGFLFDIKNGIQDIAKLDYNDDGKMDLVIAARESCRKIDTCIDIYENRGGAFARRNLSIAQTEKIVTIRAQDFNLDGFPDLIFADTSGDIKVLYNRDGKFDGNIQLLGNVGLQVDPLKNLIASVLVNYPGMTTKNPDDPASIQNYQTLPLSQGEKDFIYADADSAGFKSSIKSAQDLNGGVVKTGDKIRYTILLKNDSAAPKTNVSVSDAVSEMLELDANSVQCVDCAAYEMQVLPISADPSRQYLFSGIRVPAKSSRTIIYDATYKGETESVEKINFVFNNKFTDPDPAIQAKLQRDDYPDISVTKEGNPTGRVLYFTTAGLEDSGRIIWNPGILSSPPAPQTNQDFEEKTGIKMPTKDEIYNSIPKDENGNPTGPPPSATQEMYNLQDKDSDGDGLPDSIDDLEGGLDNIATKTSEIVSKLTCDAGCIAMPLNIAFLAPGPFSIFGVPDGYDIGIPLVGWGVPGPIPVMFGPAGLAGLGGRFYISPTLTGGVGFGVCFGPYGTPSCYSFGVNPVDLLPGNICDKINAPIGKALAGVNSALSEVSEGMTITINVNKGTAGTGGRGASGSGLTNYSLGRYDAPVTKSRNIRVPGFPKVITEWFWRQLEEMEKVLMLPDVYLIYPDPKSLVSAVTPKPARTGNVLDRILSEINSMPLVDIETQEVLFKVPIATRKEIEKLKADARQWLEDEKLELDKWRNLMGCVGIAQAIDAVGQTGTTTRVTPQPGNFGNLELCNFVTVQMNGLIKNITETMKSLDEWILFPKKIMQYRAIEAYYLGQIIDYLDTVIEFTAGWTTRNIARVKAWRKAIRNIKQAIETWKALAKLMIDYEEACDNCKTERYTLKDLILKLFMAIPAPPVIPLPKLPDIIVDVSKIQAGVKIKWPDVKFKPEPLVFPKLPRIALGVDLTIPRFKIMVPEGLIPKIPPPPDLPTLPPLPPLSLPTLPDLPPPPTMPALPKEIVALIDILRKIVKILCIIRQGFLPTSEFLLKPRIEEITARGLMPVLPIDLLFTFLSPTISVTYVDRIIVTAFMNLNMDLSYIQEQVEAAAKKANAYSTNFVKGINKETERFMKQMEKITTPTINIDIPGPEGRSLPYKPQEKELGVYTQALKDVIKSLEKVKKEQEKSISRIPEKIILNAQSVPFENKSAGTVALNSGAPDALVSYRDNLAAYLDDTEKSLKAGPIDNLSDLQRFSPIGKYIASKDLEFTLEEKPAGPVKIGQLGDFDADAQKSGRMLALLDPPQLPLPPNLAPGSGGPAETGSINDVGLFFIDVNGESRRLINYTFEADKVSQIANIDIDGDSDSDKIYSYGQNVFLKNNFKSAAHDSRPVFRPVDMEFWTVFELLPKGGSPNFPNIVSQSARDVNVTFTKSSISEIAGYEIIAKNSPLFFENPQTNETVRTHLLFDQQNTQESTITINIKEAEGQILVNGAAPEGLSININDDISIGEDSSALLEASDGTRLRAYSNTAFKLTRNSAFELASGSLEIALPRAGSAFFKTGNIISVAQGSFRLRFFDGSEIQIDAGSQFTLPEFTPVYSSLKSAVGSADFIGQKREYIQPRNGKVRVKAGEILHPLEVVRLKWDVGGIQERTLVLSKDMMVAVPDSFANGMYVEMKEGVMEIVRPEKSTQPAAAGMAVLYGDQLKIKTGTAVVHYPNGGDTVLRFNETYILNKAQSQDNPTLNLRLEPASYFAKIYAFDSAGNRSNGSEKLLMSPQICGDKTPPVANLGKANYQVAVGKKLELDASRSFDADSKVIWYSLDTDVNFDSDGDGAANNDNDAGDSKNNFSSELFSIGPYDQVGQKQMRLTVKDEAFNEGYQDITVDIVSPRIVLDVPPLRSSIVSGYVEPSEENVPVTIARLRPGKENFGWEILRTPKADSGGQYYTNADSRYSISDFDMRQRLVLRNSEDKAIAEINEKTGRIIILDDRYEARVLLSSLPNLPMRIGVFLKSDKTQDSPLTFVYFVPDVNTDVSIDNSAAEYNSQAMSFMAGVHMKLLPAANSLSLSARVLPGDDPQIPGAAVIEKEGKRMAVVDVNGDITSFDNLISLRMKQGALDDPVVFEMLYDGELIAEIFVIALPQANGNLEIVDAPKLPARPIPASNQTASRLGQKNNAQPFTDVGSQDDFTKTAAKLYKRGIIAGYPSDVKGELLFKPENPINRAEFTQITLKMLCIVPREEAKKLPSPFYDVINPNLWFYPVIKEGNIRGFIKGYLGETKQDSATGETKPLFKPANNITWAEAATVVLAALQEQNIIDISKADLSLPEGSPWYTPYVKIAQNITPYLVKPEEGKRTFLISADEAKRASEPITRKDFAIMADRVLLVYDCNNPDTDNDGIDDVWERKYGKTLPEMKPNDDLDGDMCSNIKEFENNTDPTKADTDSGGIADCAEIERGTNPVDNPYDDKPQIPVEILKSRNEEGIYVLRPDCGSVCPCRASLGSGADLQPGDIIFTAITGKNGIPIYAKSNEENY